MGERDVKLKKESSASRFFFLLEKRWVPVNYYFS